MLQAASIPGSHTADAIREKYQEMFDNWMIDNSQVHCFVVDNAANMKRAMKDGGYTHQGCFAHTLQLVVNDGILSQQYVKDILAKCRRIVGHFKHSPLDYTKFKAIQTSLGIPRHRFKQDVPTRWNSTLYMLESIVSQKMALAMYTTENDGIPQLSSLQLDIIEKVISVLKPVEDVTQSISSSTASISLIIPFVRVLRKSWEPNTTAADQGVQTMKSEMLRSLNTRFKDVEDKESLALATLLDPCFKNKFFSVPDKLVKAKDLLIGQLDSRLIPTPTSDGEPPVQKRVRTEMMKCFDDILAEATVQHLMAFPSLINFWRNHAFLIMEVMHTNGGQKIAYALNPLLG